MSPAPLKVYDANYLLQFKTQPQNQRVRALFPAEPPKEVKPEPKREIRPIRARTDFGQPPVGQPVQQVSSRPFANLHVTSDQKPILIDSNAASNNAFFSPGEAAARPGFGVQQSRPANELQRNRQFSKLENRSEHAFAPVQPKSAVEAVIKSVKGTLNKLTPEKYDVLFTNIWDAVCVFNLEDSRDKKAMTVLWEIIGLLFEKALAEQNFSDLYADVARHLCDMTTGASDSSKDEKPIQEFRKLLLDRCQTQFETTLDTLPEGEAVKHKKRCLGNIKFIAELFKRGLLTEKIMHEVIKHLLLGPPPHTEQHVPTTEELEVLCKLWRSAGKLLDRAEATEYINYYFDAMASLTQIVPDTRTRFMLTDLIELRANRWIPRREEEKAKTMAEMEEAFQEKEMQKNGSGPRGRDSGRSRPSGRATRSPPAPSFRPCPLPVDGRARAGSGAKPSLSQSPPISPATPNNMPAAMNLSTGRMGPAKGAKQRDVKRNKAPEPVKPVELSVEDMDTKVVWLIGEFKQTQNTAEFLDCLKELTPTNHTLFVTRAVYWVVESPKLTQERTMLACMLEILLNSQEKKGRVQLQGAISQGFKLALKDICEFELWSDAPFLWRNLCEFLLEVFTKEVLKMDFLNQLFPDDFLSEFVDQFDKFTVELHSQLLAKDLAWLSNSSFFRVLHLVHNSHVATLLELMEKANVLSADITLYICKALHSSTSGELLPWLQANLDTAVVQKYQQPICEKISAGLLGYLTAEVAARAADQSDEDLRELEAQALLPLEPVLRHFMACADAEREVALQQTLLTEVHRACVLHQFPRGHMCRMFVLIYERGICSRFCYDDWAEGTDRKSVV